MLPTNGSTEKGLAAPIHGCHISLPKRNKSSFWFLIIVICYYILLLFIALHLLLLSKQDNPINKNFVTYHYV